eukprot:TRINITY_DN556_c0_g1_i2.p1 TRINITY_DN556_c0_g1~~TRINITY_DN556_c0_g1_i2.p1  ORF type:complete len:511 (+),score=117.09 TRINITY_DN556_c0_g1_i2:3-1535(+)
MLPVAVGWVALAVVVVVIILFCYGIVKYYSDRHESEALPTVVTVLTLSLTLIALFIIPVDILSVSATKDKEGNFLGSIGDLENLGTNIRTLYYVLYGLIMGASFLLIPFSYFYYEEFDEDSTVRSRFIAGLKYTSFLVVILVVLFVVGIFVKPGAPTEVDYKLWVSYVLDKQDGGERSISFVIACMTLLGYLVWVTYTAYGLSAFPIGLLRGKRHVTEEASDIVSDLESTREKQREINSRYLTGKRITEADQRKVDLLKRHERTLSKRNTQLQNSQKGLARLAAVCKPFALLFGILFSLVSLFLIVCFLLSLIDKIAGSCGTACGFVISHPQLKNPIDLVLAFLEPYFPLDYIILGAIIFFIFFATLSGIIRIGIRFLWVHMFSIRAQKSPPQGLLLMTMLLMFALLTLNMQIVNLAPRYTMYGSQVYINNSTNTVEPCGLNSPQDLCTMSQIGTIVTRIQLGTPFFGVAYYILNWVFLAAFVIGLIVSIVKRKPPNVEVHEDEDDDDYR